MPGTRRRSAHLSCELASKRECILWEGLGAGLPPASTTWRAMAALTASEGLARTASMPMCSPKAEALPRYGPCGMLEHPLRAAAASCWRRKPGVIETLLADRARKLWVRSDCVSGLVLHVCCSRCERAARFLGA